MPFAATWMDLKTIILSEVGESDITYTSNLKKKKKRYKWTYSQNSNRLTDLEKKIMITKG